MANNATANQTTPKHNWLHGIDWQPVGWVGRGGEWGAARLRPFQFGINFCPFSAPKCSLRTNSSATHTFSHVKPETRTHLTGFSHRARSHTHHGITNNSIAVCETIEYFVDNIWFYLRLISFSARSFSSVHLAHRRSMSVLWKNYRKDVFSRTGRMSGGCKPCDTLQSFYKIYWQ